MIKGVLGFILCGVSTAGVNADEPGDLPETVNYNEHIAPIINNHCLVCHRAEGVGPFSFENYDQVKRRARQISEVVTSHYMPPWKPDGEFTPPLIDERKLSDREIALINAWEKGGSKPGNLDDLPEQPKFPESWVLGNPDMILTLEEAYILPAEGTDIYRNFVFNNPLEETRYVDAVEFLPESQLSIHHATLYIDETSTSRKLDEIEPGPGFGGMILATADQPGGQFVGWTPGQRPFTAYPGTAWKWKPGSDLVLQLHMLPSGKLERIAPKIGLHFSDAPPSRITSVISLREGSINIPPEENSYAVRSELTLPVEVKVLGVYPHAHYLGKDLKVYAELPNGERQWIIRIPDWDFNWQMDYRFKDPVNLPRGSKVVMDYTYDNSSENIRNPSDPPKRVKQGYRSIDEMAEVTIQVLLQNEEDLERLNRVVLDHQNLPDGQALAAFQIGWQFQETGKLDAAISAYRMALESDPKFVPALAQLGMLHFELGETEAGLNHFSRAYQADAESAENIWNLGSALFNLGSLDEASKLLYILLDKEPERMDARLMLAMVYAENNLMRLSTKLLIEGMKWHMDNPVYRLQLGKIRMSAGDLEGAQQDLLFVLEIGEPGFGIEKSRAAHALAVMKQRAGDLDTVEALLSGSIEYDTRYAPAYLQLGTLHLMNGRIEEARNLFKILVLLDDEDRPSPEQLVQALPIPEGVILLTNAYVEAGMREAASQAINETLKLLKDRNQKDHLQAIMAFKTKYQL